MRGLRDTESALVLDAAFQDIVEKFEANAERLRYVRIAFGAAAQVHYISLIVTSLPRAAPPFAPRGRRLSGKQAERR